MKPSLPLSVFEFAAKTVRHISREFRVAWVSGVEAAQRDALVEFEEENEFLEPRSADFNDEPLPTPSEHCVCGHTQYVHDSDGCNVDAHYEVGPCYCTGFRLSMTPAASAVVEDSIFRSGGQTKQYGPRPRIATSQAALCACGHWLHPANVCAACGCNNVRLAPVASAAVMSGPEEGATPLAPQPSSGALIDYRGEQLSWCDYVQPAIEDVLALHPIYMVRGSGHVVCDHGNYTEFADMQEWREHVAPLIAERLEQVTLALPEGGAL